MSLATDEFSAAADSAPAGHDAGDAGDLANLGDESESDLDGVHQPRDVPAQLAGAGGGGDPRFSIYAQAYPRRPQGLGDVADTVDPRPTGIHGTFVLDPNGRVGVGNVGKYRIVGDGYGGKALD